MSGVEKIIVGLLVVLTVGFSGLAIVAESAMECSYEVVEQVGGCDKWGRCGVKTDKGATKAYYPVVGQTLCVKGLKGMR